MKGLQNFATVILSILENFCWARFVYNLGNKIMKTTRSEKKKVTWIVLFDTNLFFKNFAQLEVHVVVLKTLVELQIAKFVDVLRDFLEGMGS